MTYSPAQLAAVKALLARSRDGAVDTDALCSLCPQQAAAVRDQSRNVVIVAGRRGAKSFGAVLKGLTIARAVPNVSVVYTAATKDSVKRIAWEAARYFNDRLGLKAVESWTDKTLTLPNGSRQYLFGVDSEKAADLAGRGIHRLAFIAIDECQRYRDDVLGTFIKAVRPALRDVAGTLWLLGTPNPKGKVGVLWDRLRLGLFSAHTWTSFDNGYLGTREEQEAIVDEDLRAEGETREGAFYRREYLAEWVVDLASRAYKFDDTLNVYADLPTDLTHSLLCVDIGYGDADAIGDLAWNEDKGTVYLRREDIEAGQTVTDLGSKLQRMAHDTMPILITVDAGGGGLKDLATLQQMLPQLPLQAAVKPDVHMQVKALNNLLVPGRFKVRAESRFAKDVRQVGWVKGIVGGKLDEVAFHSDIIPACRYGVIAAAPFLPQIAVELPEPLARAIGIAEATAARFRRSKRLVRKIDPLAVDDDETEDMGEGEAIE